ncbi:MAG: hypothetical protein Q9166_003439 [cf. Caloplaca sp. 2 TL-2023]
MVSTQASAKATGKRKPLGELSNNSTAKRAKPTRDLHHGETTVNEPSSKERSLSGFPSLGAAVGDGASISNKDPVIDDEVKVGRSEYQALKDTAITIPEEGLGSNSEDNGDDGTKAEESKDEHLHTIIENEVFNLDAWDNGEYSESEAAKQAKELEAVFLYLEKNDHLAHSTTKEREERKLNCGKRLKDMLENLLETAKGVKKEAFSSTIEGEEPPFTFAWWALLVHLDAKAGLELQIASLPESVQVILGGPLDTKELLMLPSEWKGCSLWGVYTYILTETVDMVEVETARYTGPGTAAVGLHSRLPGYPAMKVGTRIVEKRKHCEWLVRSLLMMNLRVIAVFEKCATAKPYVLLMEFMGTILLQTLPLFKTGLYCKASTIAMIRRAMPEGLPVAKHEALNNASQCLQGLWFRRRGTVRVCQNMCTGQHKFYSAIPGLPFSGKYISVNCYCYRRNHDGKYRGFSTRNCAAVVLPRSLLLRS